MLINNEHVAGIFLYTAESSQIEFEKDDLLVSGDCIYICTAKNPTNPKNNTVSGIDPKDDTLNENFKPYPGSRAMTASEFFDYLESNNKDDIEDKYVSSRAIVGILQRFQFGLSMTGVITDYIDEKGSSLKLDSVTVNPLDDLMLTEDLNNGMVRVSPLLSQIVDGELSGGVKFSNLFGILETTNVHASDYSLILRQYTYKSSSTQSVRIQELISPMSGITVYRFMTWIDSFPTSGEDISSWRNTYTYSTTLLNRLNALTQYYTRSAENFRSKLAQLSGSFRFREVANSYSGNTIDLAKSNKIYTVCLLGPSINNASLYSCESVTIRTDTMVGYTITLTNLSGTLKITNNSTTIRLTIEGTSISFTSIYYQELYG